MEAQEEANLHRLRDSDDFTDDELAALFEVARSSNYKFIDEVRFGARADYADEANAFQHATLRLAAVTKELPAKADLAEHSPEILSQGKLGACVAHAIVEGWQISRRVHNWKKGRLSYFTGLKVFRPSRLYVYWNAKVVEGTPPRSDSGCTVHGALKGVEAQSLCREDLWEYRPQNFGVQPPAKCYSDATTHGKSPYTKVFQSLNTIKESIASGNPVIFGAVLFESCYTRRVAHTGVIPLPDKERDAITGGHCMLLVGYDDNTRLFKLQNSWGRIWGDSGFGYIPYDYVLDRELCGDFWAFRF